MIPKLEEFYTSKKDSSFKIIAISLDANKNDWLNFIKTNKLDWLNLNDPKGWNGAAATSYSLYATPTMFLVDKDKKILGKPLTIEELQKMF